MIGFLKQAPPSAAVETLFAEDVDELGYVMNVSRLWAYQPESLTGLFDLARAVTAGRFDLRQRAVLVAACAAAAGDSYCSLAWGVRLAATAGEETAAGVL